MAATNPASRRIPVPGIAHVNQGLRFVEACGAAVDVEVSPHCAPPRRPALRRPRGCGGHRRRWTGPGSVNGPRPGRRSAAPGARSTCRPGRASRPRSALPPAVRRVSSFSHAHVMRLGWPWRQRPRCTEFASWYRLPAARCRTVMARACAPRPGSRAASGPCARRLRPRRPRSAPSTPRSPSTEWAISTSKMLTPEPAEQRAHLGDHSGPVGHRDAHFAGLPERRRPRGQVDPASWRAR